MRIRTCLLIPILVLNIILNTSPTRAQQNVTQQGKNSSQHENQSKTEKDKADTGDPVTTRIDGPVTVQGPIHVIRDPSAEEKQRQAEDELKPFWRRPEWVAIIVGGFAAFFALLAFYAANRQAKSAEQTLAAAMRPKIIVRNFTVELPGDTPQENRLFGTFYIANIGGSDARVIDFTGEIIVRNDETLPMKRPYDAQAENRTPLRKLDQPVLAPGEERELSIPEITIGAIQQKSISNMCYYGGSDNLPVEYIRTTTVYVVGNIRYADKVNVVRRTAFCRQLLYSTRRFVPVDDPDYEYTD